MDLGILARSAWRQVQGSASESLYLRTGIDTTAPTTIKATINERCNYKCHYCNFWQQDAYVDEMTIDDWRRALISLKDFIGPYLIQFSGGEPFMKKGFVDLLGMCRDEGISWGVITNGSAFSQKIVTRVVEASPCNIDISLDAPDPDNNDFVRGAPGSFLKIEKAITFLRAERERLGQSFPIRIKTVVHRLNFRDLIRMVDWAQNIGADTIDFSPVHPIAKRYWTQELDQELWIHGQEIDELEKVVEQLVARIKSDRMIETAVERILTWGDHFRKKHIPLGLSPCRVGMRDYHIRTDGSVSVCWVYPPIGNVKKQGAQEIWYSETARRIRERTTDCTYFGEIHCANSCLSHRSLKQEVRRGLRVLRQVADH
jgi:MoaA/NifB/PqqE/SkfB family radical SAM enzyme